MMLRILLIATFFYQYYTNGNITITIHEPCCYCTNCTQDYIIYELNNTSTEDYYTWVDFNSSFTTREKAGIIRYFFSRHGDFSLGSLLHDNVVFKEKFIPVIGETFLKRIKPNESFRYIVSKQISEDFKDHLFFTDELTLISIVGNPVNLEYAIWEKDSITIHEEDVPSSRAKILLKKQ